MDTEELPLLDALWGLSMLQQEFLRLALFVMNNRGQITFLRPQLAPTLQMMNVFEPAKAGNKRLPRNEMFVQSR